ncbi:hypothetical protein E4U54_005533, partial [Claviceps lovelessii]
FTVADESCYPEFRKQLVLSTADGGSSTLKSPFHDQINNNKLWGPLYDGRAIMSTIHERFLGGATVQDLQRSLEEDFPGEEAVKLIRLVKQAKPAGEIVTEVREGAKERIRKLAARL